MSENIRKDCVFCRIADGDIPAKLLWEDDDVVAFPDANPVAPVHILIIPRKHLENLNAVTVEDMEVLGKINYIACDLAKRAGLDESGWRLVANCGKDAGQEVFHLHFHLIGGSPLGHFCEK